MSISNNPPPFEAMSLTVEDLIAEANNWLDGEPVATQGQADEIGKLINTLRLARKEADNHRDAEKRPHDEASKAVQAKWKPLLERCDLAASVAKKALVPWLEKVEAEQKAVAEKRAREAEEARLAALEAERVAALSNKLDDAEDAQAAREVASLASKMASAASNKKAHTKGGGRALGLRTKRIAEIVDRRELLKHYMLTAPEELEAWLLDQAQRDVNGGAREIPGVSIREERIAA